MRLTPPTIRFRVDGLHDCEAWHAALVAAESRGQIPVPAVAIKQAARIGIDLRGHFVEHLIIDKTGQFVHLQMVKPSGPVILLPVIHFTEENFHPMHGPSGHWWEAMEACKWGSEGTYLSVPLIEEIKGALGGLDMTGVFVKYIATSIEGYQIRVDAGAFDAVPNV
jgi:hypothetical protein